MCPAKGHSHPARIGGRLRGGLFSSMALRLRHLSLKSFDFLASTPYRHRINPRIGMRAGLLIAPGAKSLIVFLDDRAEPELRRCRPTRPVLHAVGKPRRATPRNHRLQSAPPQGVYHHLPRIRWI